MNGRGEGAGKGGGKGRGSDRMIGHSVRFGRVHDAVALLGVCDGDGVLVGAASDDRAAGVLRRGIL